MRILYTTQSIVNGTRVISVAVGAIYNPDSNTKRYWRKPIRFEYPPMMTQAQAHAHIIKEYAKMPATCIFPMWFAQIQIDAQRFAFYEVNESNTICAGALGINNK